ncbi:MAG: ATP synthase F1 subunit gamma [Planctomycetota bacterium]|jgi:F-type H+-transporting ATPase subunit gamma|nr:ATP synthase F1 subunit gamma [Planctomycetota bacterium]
MANTRELRSRRKSITNTRKTTRTMELVASTKLRKAQEAAESSRPYAEGMFALVARLAAAGGDGDDVHPLMVQRAVNKVVLILACSDRGLCGAFNVNLVKKLNDRAKDLRAAGKQVEVVTCGKKGAAILRFIGENVVEQHSGIMDAPEYSRAQDIGEGLMDDFLAGRVDSVELIYSRYETAARQYPDCTTLLPAGGVDAAAAADDAGGYFIYHPDAASLLESLIPQMVKVALFSCFLQTSAGEHAARRSAMKNATDAAGDLIKLLTRQYNRARQGKITQEIAEIVGAVEAMA